VAIATRGVACTKPLTDREGRRLMLAGGRIDRRGGRPKLAAARTRCGRHASGIARGQNCHGLQAHRRRISPPACRQRTAPGRPCTRKRGRPKANCCSDPPGAERNHRRPTIKPPDRRSLKLTNPQVLTIPRSRFSSRSASRASDNPGYDIDVRPAPPLKKVVDELGDC
jgi:hypothetical protein